MVMAAYEKSLCSIWKKIESDKCWIARAGPNQNGASSPEL